MMQMIDMLLPYTKLWGPRPLGGPYHRLGIVGGNMRQPPSMLPCAPEVCGAAVPGGHHIRAATQLSTTPHMPKR